MHAIRTESLRILKCVFRSMECQFVGTNSVIGSEVTYLFVLETQKLFSLDVIEEQET